MLPVWTELSLEQVIHSVAVVITSAGLFYYCLLMPAGRT